MDKWIKETGQAGFLHHQKLSQLNLRLPFLSFTLTIAYVLPIQLAQCQNESPATLLPHHIASYLVWKRYMRLYSIAPTPTTVKRRRCFVDRNDRSTQLNFGNNCISIFKVDKIMAAASKRKVYKIGLIIWMCLQQSQSFSPHSSHQITRYINTYSHAKGYVSRARISINLLPMKSDGWMDFGIMLLWCHCVGFIRAIDTWLLYIVSGIRIHLGYYHVGLEGKRVIYGWEEWAMCHFACKVPSSTTQVKGSLICTCATIPYDSP